MNKNNHPQTDSNNKQKKKGKRRLLKIFLSVFLVVDLCFIGIFAGFTFSVIKSTTQLDVLTSPKLNMSSMLYYTDSKGATQELSNVYSSQNRIWVDISSIPKNFQNAFISIEDERFEKHKGVDFKRTVGAVINYVVGKGSYGGSTITQQLVKNITGEDQRSPTRKIQEMIRALYLESQLTKSQILEMYMNTIYLSNNCYGVQSASNLYFNKDVSKLTLAEAASIAGITQYPSRFDPFSNPDKNKEKQEKVLKKMLELKKITQEEYDVAIAEKLKFNKNGRQDVVSNVQSYFVDQVITDVINDLQVQKGYTKTFAEQLIYSGGLKIHTTIDPTIQKDMEEVFYSTSNFPKTSGSVKPEGAMVIINPYDGSVKGLIGGIGKKASNRTLDRACQIRRQPGSSIKPISVYGPAIESGAITPVTIINDSYFEAGNWSPKNSYSGYKGNMLARKALEISANIPAVKTLQSIGVDYSYNFLSSKVGITSLAKADKNLASLALGGLTNGISPLEMAGAYSVFVNSGKYNKPTTYTKVLDDKGVMLLQYKTEPKYAMSSESAFITASMLYSVVNGENGTGRSAALSADIPTYGKTGTTNDDKDRWFVGFTPYYVGAVWYGFDQPKSLRNAGVSYNPSAAAFKMVMDKIHSNLSRKELEQPSTVETASVCSVTGKLATSSCPSYTEYFKKGTVPTAKCNVHISSGTKTPNTQDFTNDSIESAGETTGTPAPVPSKKPVHTSPLVTSPPVATSPPTATPEVIVIPETSKPTKTTPPVATQPPLKPNPTPTSGDVIVIN